MIDVVVDPDLKVGANNQLTFVGYKDINGDEVPDIGTTVRVWNFNTGEITTGIIIAVNIPAMLVYLAVAWAEFTALEIETSTE